MVSGEPPEVLLPLESFQSVFTLHNGRLILCSKGMEVGMLTGEPPEVLLPLESFQNVFTLHNGSGVKSAKILIGKKVVYQNING